MPMAKPLPDNYLRLRRVMQNHCTYLSDDDFMGNRDAIVDTAIKFIDRMNDDFMAVKEELNRINEELNRIKEEQKDQWVRLRGT